MSDLISQLEAWYAARCVPGLDNHHGFHIANVAEGGWWLRVDMPAKELVKIKSALQPLRQSIDDFPNAWIHYSMIDGAFIGGCASRLLHQLLSAFLSAASQIHPDNAEPIAEADHVGGIDSPGSD